MSPLNFKRFPDRAAATPPAGSGPRRPAEAAAQPGPAADTPVPLAGPGLNPPGPPLPSGGARGTVPGPAAGPRHAAGPGTPGARHRPCVTPAPGRSGAPCGDGDAAHDIRVGDGARTACSVHLGPDGHGCGCTAYRPAEAAP